MQSIIIILIGIFTAFNSNAVAIRVSDSSTQSKLSDTNRKLDKQDEKLKKINDDREAQKKSVMRVFMNSIDALSQKDPIKGIKDINSAKQSIQRLCNLCKKDDLAELRLYQAKVESDLCKQFTYALDTIAGIKENAMNLQGIMSMFNSQPEAAAISLKKAAVKTQRSTERIMAQMHYAQMEQQQKELAKEKAQKSLTKQTSDGFKKFKM